MLTLLLISKLCLELCQLREHHVRLGKRLSCETRNNESSTNNRPLHVKEDTETVLQPKCFRLEEIPITVTEEELQRQLALSLDGQESSSLHLTLARSFGEYQTATFMSTSIPRNLEYPVDSEFIGVTPLFEPEDAVIEYENSHSKCEI